MGRATDIAQQRHRPDFVMRVAAFAARLALARGNVDVASRWAQTCGIRSDDDVSVSLEIEHTTLARLLIAQRQPNKALSLLERMLASAEAAGRIGRVIEILALQALAFRALGDSTSAMKAFERALALAEPEGYVRLFVDEGELQVLRLVAVGLTDQQMAEELVVVLVTIKAHINNIYRKLDVTNRVQAVARARELNLL